MALPEFTMRQLLEAGVHYGHQTARWNPRMGEFIYGDRNGIHILDLTQTVPLLDNALKVVRDTVAKGGRILFVGTKRQAQKSISESAEKCAQYYMNHRWLGGTLTNWKTIQNSIARLKSLDEILAGGAEGLTKKERLGMEREQGKLQASLGGIMRWVAPRTCCLSWTWAKKPLRSPKPKSWASRWSASWTATARPKTSTTSSRAMMTRAVRLRFTATS